MSFQGVFALPVIPFNTDETFDEASLVKEIEFCLKANVHGIAIPLESGEFYRLSDQERLKTAEITVQIVNNKCPVVIGVHATNIPLAVKFAQHAQRIGASAIISVPPYVTPVSFHYTLKYFQALSDIVTIPIIIQNPTPPLGPSLSIDQIIAIVQNVKHVKYVKEEGIPTGQRISQLLKRGNNLIKGVFGGLGGKFMFNEFERGSAGIMPSCQVVDVHVQIYENYIKGNLQTAKNIFNRLLPLMNLDGNGMWLQNAKTILMKRGIIKNNLVRGGQNSLDILDRKELDKAFTEVKSSFLI